MKLLILAFTWTKGSRGENICIFGNKASMKIKAANFNWLLNKNSKLSLDNKVLLHNAVIKPICMYGIQLWGTTCATNIDKIQRLQSEILRAITSSWYIRNENIHKDLGMPMVKK